MYDHPAIHQGAKGLTLAQVRRKTEPKQAGKDGLAGNPVRIE